MHHRHYDIHIQYGPKLAVSMQFAGETMRRNEYKHTHTRTFYPFVNAYVPSSLRKRCVCMAVSVCVFVYAALVYIRSYKHAYIHTHTQTRTFGALTAD